MNPFLITYDAPPQRWWERAECGRPETSPVFIKTDASRPRQNDVVLAKEICTRCPVLDQCRTEALVVTAGLHKEEMIGVVGGMTVRERALLTMKWCRQCQTAPRVVHTAFCEECREERRIRRRRESVAS